MDIIIDINLADILRYCAEADGLGMLIAVAVILGAWRLRKHVAGRHAGDLAEKDREIERLQINNAECREIVVMLAKRTPGSNGD